MCVSVCVFLVLAVRLLIHLLGNTVDHAVGTAFSFDGNQKLLLRDAAGARARARSTLHVARKGGLLLGWLQVGECPMYVCRIPLQDTGWEQI